MNTRQWGALMAQHRRVVITIWLVVLVACCASFPYLFNQLKAPNYGVNGSESARVSQLLQRHFSGQGNEQDVIVFDAVGGQISDPSHRAAVGRVLTAARRQRGVITVISPFDPHTRNQVSRDGRAALALVGMNGNSHQLTTRATGLQKAVRAASGGGVQAYLTGYTPVTNDQTIVESADSERAESIGMPVALVVLVLALGALVAAILPLLLAIVGIILTFGVIAVLTLGFSFDGFLLTIVTMIGTGIGIDYAMFVVSRFREELARRGVTRRDGQQRGAVAEAAGVAVTTSGRTILFSGVIVAISVCSLYIVSSPVFREISTGVLVAVLCTLTAALTLLPAVLAVLGPRVNAGSLLARLRPADTRPDVQIENGSWARWVHAVMRRPVIASVIAVAILVLAALPLGSLKYGIDLGATSLKGRPSASAEQILARSFSPGAVSPIQILVTGPGDTPLGARGSQQAERLAAAISRDSRVADVETLESGGRVLLNAVPNAPIDSTAATGLVRHIRKDLSSTAAGQEVLVGGATAQFVDLSTETTNKLPYVLILVLGLSLLFLLFAFRSIALPIKAVLMNLLVTGAAVGLTVAVFQWGHGESLLGFKSAGFLQVYLPITVFVLLFGLSMDYEVFLIRRIKETWEQDHDNVAAIAGGVEHTARPIAAAAAIMVAVFGSFLAAGILELKEFGLSLAAAIALDATLVRLVLVPALMRLIGKWNWWLPASLSRRLPAREEAQTTDAATRFSNVAP